MPVIDLNKRLAFHCVEFNDIHILGVPVYQLKALGTSVNINIAATFLLPCSNNRSSEIIGFKSW